MKRAQLLQLISFFFCFFFHKALYVSSNRSKDCTKFLKSWKNCPDFLGQPKISKVTKGFSYDVLWHCEDKIFSKKVWITVFDIPKKFENANYRNFGVTHPSRASFSENAKTKKLNFRDNSIQISRIVSKFRK